jgi:hypothetical protein
MTQLVIKETRELILAGEISRAEAHLVVVAEQEGDHALVEVLDEMAPKDVLAVIREYDASKESVVNLLVSPEQFVQAIVLERQYGEPIEKYVPQSARFWIMTADQVWRNWALVVVNLRTAATPSFSRTAAPSGRTQPASSSRAPPAATS